MIRAGQSPEAPWRLLSKKDLFSLDAEAQAWRSF